MKKILSTTLSLLTAIALQAANTVTTVSQQTSAIQLTDDVDYVITSSTPFGADGKVDIVNTEHAVLIFQDIRPSQVIKSHLTGRVYINGQQAVNGSNCQVKMYAHGAIVMPYGSGFKPLTVYSEKNFGGTAVNSFGLENTGGYMNTLSEAKLNNKIRSFKLKRGYMVTFSTRPEGRGYSRCFIADKEDLEISSLPIVLDERISSYRVFQWYDAQKKGLASDTREDANNILASAWCYDWGTGVNRLPDTECVPNHIYEDWPSSSACGSVNYSCHMKTNNEPGNSADDHPQSVETVLENWENLMRTGLRLCSESSHDGSMSHLKAFIDSIDARGWRCDILDLHCYWPSGTFNNLTWYSDNYGNGRPIWISEWVWGASWNNNGAFNVSNRNDYEGNWQNTYNGTKPILDVINNNSRVERYAYWNSEANCSKILLDGKLSTLGEYYANMKTGLAYNKSNEFIPRNPRQYNPSDLNAVYDKASHKVTLSWNEYNGEYNRSMEIQYCLPGTSQWRTLQEVTPQEAGGAYSVEVEGRDGYKYRVRLVDLNNKERLTNVATAVNEHLEYGDEITLGEETLYLGGNLLVNGSFDLGTTDWTNGKGDALTAPYFQVLPVGGIDGGAYLQCYGGSSTDKNAKDAILKFVSLKSNAKYYVQAAGCHNEPSYQRISTSSYASLETNPRISLPNVSVWAKQGASFEVTVDTILIIQMRKLNGVAQFDDIMACQLFPTREEAMADALMHTIERLACFKQINTTYPALNSCLEALATTADANQLESAIQEAIALTQALNNLDKQSANIALAIGSHFPGAVEMQEAQQQLATANSLEDYHAAIEKMEEAIAYSFEAQKNNTDIKNPSFNGSANWSISGTYTGGDQRTATQAGKSCWNAWWSLPAANNQDKTLGINQQISGLATGFYAVKCKATTQHLCESDQHAYIATTNGKACSETLPLGLLDLPNFSNDEIWQPLTTSYLYVEAGETVNVGFESSKVGATDGSWIKYGDATHTGDKREGWWCATDFELLYLPVFKRAADAAGWGTICLPYNIKMPDASVGLTIYELAGININTAEICLQEVSEMQAGYPYIFHLAPESDALFFESGNPVSSAKTNINGLRGIFEASSRYNVGSLVLTDGVWKYIATTADRFSIPSYSAYIKDPTLLTRLESWSGVALPSEGYTVGIESIHTSLDTAPAYNLAGQRIDAHSKGIRISNGEKVYK